MQIALVLVLSAALTWFTYWRLERLGSRALKAALARGVAWGALGILLLDVPWATHPAIGGGRPLVLLDGSLSMTAAGGHWSEARDSAGAWGEVRLFGDRRPGAGSVPAFGRSDLAPAIAAAAASDRRVFVVTDGEITDPTDVSPEALARVGVRVFPRAPVADLALTRVAGPARVTAGDTVRLEAEVRAFGAAPDTANVEVRQGERVLAHRVVRLGADGAVVVPLSFSSRGLAGDVLLQIGLSGANDAEPRDDARLWIVRVTPTPGIVFIANPTDWDGRFLFRTLREVAQLPIRGYTSVEAGRWRSMETLALVSAEEVTTALRHADVLVIKGAAPAIARDVRAAGVWTWPSGEDGETIIPGEWYAVANPASPVASAFFGAPTDSFPPLFQITPVEPAGGDWIGVSVQLGRRGAERPVLSGRVVDGRRRVTTAADGFWRWAFRGGSSEEAYRTLVANTVAWLLGGADANSARARPLHPVVPNGRSIEFEWVGAGRPVPLGITTSLDGETARDTLRFDGAGRAELWLSTGTHRYQLDGGGQGLLAVDLWSDEWLERPAVLKDRPLPATSPGGVTSSRRWIWLFALAVLALSVEWLMRRNLGLR